MSHRPHPAYRLPLATAHGGGRFPGFDVLDQSRHWDETTTSVVYARLGPQPAIRFFTQAEEAIAGALFDQLLDQREEPRVPVVAMVDARLAEDQTDGWHYDGMPQDHLIWRQSLAWLDEDAERVVQRPFAGAEWKHQAAVLDAVQRQGDEDWHGMVAARVWSLWTRYACTAFYSHPWAWNEIGFDGPAYPRGYKNMGVDRLEPFEVPDARPTDYVRGWTS